MSVFIENLQYRYPKASSPAVDVSRLELRDNVTAVIGSNGAGKSTLFKCLEGFLKAQSGSISKQGGSAKEFRSAQVFQTEQFFDHITVREWIEFHALLKRIPLDDEGIDDCLERCGLSGEGHRIASQLSGGQQRRLNLVCALIGSLDLLILDEPTTGLGLDYVAQFSVEKMDRFHAFEDYDRFEDSGMVTLFIPQERDFFARFGSLESLIAQGIALRRPDMSDVYTRHYKEVIR